jgi:hypothetical protein
MSSIPDLNQSGGRGSPSSTRKSPSTLYGAPSSPQSSRASEASSQPSSTSTEMPSNEWTEPSICRDQHWETSQSTYVFNCNQIAESSTSPSNNIEPEPTSRRRTNCHPHVRQVIDVIHEGSGHERSCDVMNRWGRRSRCCGHTIRMPPAIEETRPKEGRPKRQREQSWWK